MRPVLSDLTMTPAGGLVMVSMRRASYAETAAGDSGVVLSAYLEGIVHHVKPSNHFAPLNADYGIAPFKLAISSREKDGKATSKTVIPFDSA